MSIDPAMDCTCERSAYTCCIFRFPDPRCCSGNCSHVCCREWLYRVWDSSFEDFMHTAHARAEARAAGEGRYFRTLYGIEMEAPSDVVLDWDWGPPSLFQVMEEAYQRRLQCALARGKPITPWL